MIDLSRALGLAWERMLVILFQPLDASKWFVIGFNAFLVMLGEGGVQFNRPISFTQQKPMPFTGTSLPSVIHQSKQWVESLGNMFTGPALIWYLLLGLAYIVGWVVLNWVGSRGQFLFVDNIVRNRAAIAWPWHRYAREGNLWFLFQLGLSIFTIVLMILSAGLFLLVSWPWIAQERNPQGMEVAVLAVFLFAFLVFWCVVSGLLFLVRSFVVPLLFKQTYGLGSALGAVIHLLFSRPLSILAYLLASFVVAIIGSILSVVAVCVVCCCIFWLGFIPIIGSLMITAVLAQLLLPILVFYRCFQIECLSQFGPAYDIWGVDVPPAQA